jgi:hypothetical protein
MIDPTRKEWEAARKRMVFVDRRSADADARTEAALGPCPPEPAPTSWRSGGIGTLLVTPHADGGVWVGFPHVQHEKLTPDEADTMADSLCAHAHYARKQADDPWRSDEEAAALIDAIKEPKVCGRIIDGDLRQAPTCQRPEGHPVGGCRPHRMAADDE